jgi:hypothetical protein
VKPTVKPKANPAGPLSMGPLSLGLLVASLLATTLLAMACGGAAEESQDASVPEQPEEELTVTGGEAYHGLLPYRARDAKLALVEPSFVTADEAQLVDGVSVVGVAADGVYRAYPLYVLKNHQVVNDRLGNVPIAASW